MSPSLRWLTIVALALVATAARAEFHTFQIEQLYSNADGSVQFVVLHESQGMDGENFLQGQALTSTRMGVTKTYIFPTSLPGGGMMCDGYYGCSPTPSPTANSRVLIGTAGFAAPEVIEGQPATLWSDLYSLGATFYRLVAGRCASGGSIASPLHPLG